MSPPVSDADLSGCDREPIHLLGGIQPRGVLVAFQEDPRAVAVVSANVAALLGAGPDALLGQAPRGRPAARAARAWRRARGRGPSSRRPRGSRRRGAAPRGPRRSAAPQDTAGTPPRSMKNTTTPVTLT
ncbi:hypothetical protein [Corallococcus sp. RDP092CA]|uniref:hypothetical protein n=1 Tax=Corallococcus sp. RDP092CA TaxID=3109369 RepID=UPI0035B07ED3